MTDSRWKAACRRTGHNHYTHTHTLRELNKHNIYFIYKYIFLVPIDPLTMLLSICSTTQLQPELREGVCVCVWNLNLGCPPAATQSGWCNSVGEMWYFRAIYLDYAKYRKIPRGRVHQASLSSPLCVNLSWTIFSKSASNLFCSFLQMPMSRGLGLGPDRLSKLNTWRLPAALCSTQLVFPLFTPTSYDSSRFLQPNCILELPKHAKYSASLQHACGRKVQSSTENWKSGLQSRTLPAEFKHTASVSLAVTKEDLFFLFPVSFLFKTSAAPLCEH